MAAKNTRATWLGLFLSLFAMVAIRQAFVFFAPEITFAPAILKETLIWAGAAALLVIIRRGEGLPFKIDQPPVHVAGGNRWHIEIYLTTIVPFLSG